MAKYDDDNAPLTVAQRDALLEMLADQQRVNWLWKSARTWAGYIAAGMTFSFAAYKFIVDYWRHQ